MTSHSAPPAPTYPYAIPSLLQAIHNLPVLGDLDLNRSIQASTPIDPANLQNAKVVAKKMKATLNSPANPGVTEEMLASAELRLRSVEEAHATALYAPGLMTGIATILQRLETIEREIKINNTMILNHRIIARNTLNQPLCEPLIKSVPGHGLPLALAVTRSAQERQALVAPLAPAPIGAVPPDFVNNITKYTAKDIANLIIFYNEDFGVVETDDIGTRRSKLIFYLSHYS